MPRGNPSPKLAITIDPDIHENILAAAARDGVSVSAWMTAAARPATPATANREETAYSSPRRDSRRTGGAEHEEKGGRALRGSETNRPGGLKVDAPRLRR